MGRIERSIEIKAPREKVFAFYTDHKSWEKTAPEDAEVKVERISEKPLGVGTTMRFTGLIGGRKVEADGEWVDFEVNRKLGFRQIKGEMKKWEGAIVFETTDRGTKVTTTVDYKLPYWVLGMIMDMLRVRKELERLYKAFDEGAKKIIEEE